jgi:hypothetical protein
LTYDDFRDFLKRSYLFCLSTFVHFYFCITRRPILDVLWKIFRKIYFRISGKLIFKVETLTFFFDMKTTSDLHQIWWVGAPGGPLPTTGSTSELDPSSIFGNFFSKFWKIFHNFRVYRHLTAPEGRNTYSSLRRRLANFQENYETSFREIDFQSFLSWENFHGNFHMSN